MRLILDSGGVTALASQSSRAVALHRWIAGQDLWPPEVPAVVLVECLTGDPGKDARVNLVLKQCVVLQRVPEKLARRAAQMRTAARCGSAVDALVVAYAEKDGKVLTGDLKDLRALAQYADGVVVESV